MADLLAFCSMDEFIDNTSNAVNPVGELSAYGRTYSKDVLIYAGAEVTMEVFDASNASPSEITALPTVYQAVATALTNIPGAYVGAGDPVVETTNALGVSFTVNSVGPGIFNPIDGDNYPAYIDFNYTGEAGTYHFIVWLANAPFKDDYPKCEITIIPPLNNIANVDDIIDDWVNARAEIIQVTPANMFTRIATVFGEQAYTQANIEELRIHDPNDYGTFYDSYWGYVINGNPSECSLADVLGAIEDLILSNSAYPLNTWLDVIPELAPMNRFYIIPNWQNIAVSNGSLATPIMSPTIKEIDFDGVVATYFPSETDVPGAEAVIEYSVALYKSAGFFALADITNPEGRIAFSAKFPDYFVIDANDTYINTLAPETQAVIRNLDELIREADTYTDGDTLDPQIEAVEIGSNTFLSKQQLGVELFVLTRESVVP